MIRLKNTTRSFQDHEAHLVDEWLSNNGYMWKGCDDEGQDVWYNPKIGHTVIVIVTED